MEHVFAGHEGLGVWSEKLEEAGTEHTNKQGLKITSRKKAGKELLAAPIIIVQAPHKLHRC